MVYNNIYIYLLNNCLILKLNILVLILKKVLSSLSVSAVFISLINTLIQWESSKISVFFIF